MSMDPLKELLLFVQEQEEFYYHLMWDEMAKGNMVGMVAMQCQAAAFHKVRCKIEAMLEEE